MDGCYGGVVVATKNLAKRSEYFGNLRIISTFADVLKVQTTNKLNNYNYEFAFYSERGC